MQKNECRSDYILQMISYTEKKEHKNKVIHIKSHHFLQCQDAVFTSWTHGATTQCL